MKHDPAGEPIIERRECANCGVPLKPGARRCHQCGAKVKSEGWELFWTTIFFVTGIAALAAGSCMIVVSRISIEGSRPDNSTLFWGLGLIAFFLVLFYLAFFRKW